MKKNDHETKATDSIELSLGDFTAMKVDRLPSGAVHFTPMDATFYQELIDRGWREKRCYKQGDRTVVILERRPK